MTAWMGSIEDVFLELFLFLCILQHKGFRFQKVCQKVCYSHQLLLFSSVTRHCRPFAAFIDQLLLHRPWPTR